MSIILNRGDKGVTNSHADFKTSGTDFKNSRIDFKNFAH